MKHPTYIQSLTSID